MATPTLDQDIQNRIQSFLAELSGLVRRSAMEAVRGVLGEGPAPKRRGPGRPRGSSTAKRRPGRSRKAAATGFARAGRRVRRSAADLEKIAARVLAHVKSNAGHRLEQIGKALQTDTGVLKRPIANLLAAGKLRTQGRKRGTMYFAGGSRGGATKARRKAKVQRRRKARRTLKAKVSRRTVRKKSARRAVARIVRPARVRPAKARRKPSRVARPSKARAVADALALQAAAMPGAPL